MQDLIYGITSYLKGLKVIARYNLWVYFLAPTLLSLILAYFIFSTAWNLSDDMGGWVSDFYPIEWGKAVFENVATAIGGLGIVTFSFLIFKYIIMAITAPFMSLMSEKLEQKMYPGSLATAFSLSKMVSDLIRGLRIALRNVFRELFLTLGILLLGLIIPFISPIVPVLLILLQSYYAGFANFDYTLERRFNLRQSVRFVKDNRMLAIGNGLVFVLSLMTVVGFVFTLPLGAAGGAVLVLEKMEED